MDVIILFRDVHVGDCYHSVERELFRDVHVGVIIVIIL